MAKSIKKRSKVWEYFDVSDNNPSKAVCKLCEQQVSRGGTDPRNFTTTNLTNHLKRLHPTEHNVMKASQVAADTDQLKAAATEKVIQPTIAQAFKTSKAWEPTHPNALKYNALIGCMIAVDSQPFSIVEDQGFKDLINAALPKYKLPGEKLGYILSFIHLRVKLFAHYIKLVLVSAVVDWYDIILHFNVLCKPE